MEIVLHIKKNEPKNSHVLKNQVILLGNMTKN